jgi:hypothetical protein
MNTTTHRRMAVLWVLALAAGLMLAVAGTARAKPFTFTEVQKNSESFSDEPTLCQNEIYTTTITSHSVEHVTYFEDTGAVHYHFMAHGKVVAVPWTGPGLATEGTSGLAIRRTSGTSSGASS